MINKIKVPVIVKVLENNTWCDRDITFLELSSQNKYYEISFTGDDSGLRHEIKELYNLKYVDQIQLQTIISIDGIEIIVKLVEVKILLNNETEYNIWKVNQRKFKIKNLE